MNIKNLNGTLTATWRKVYRGLTPLCTRVDVVHDVTLLEPRRHLHVVFHKLWNVALDDDIAADEAAGILYF